MAVASNLTGEGQLGVFDSVAASQTDSALVTAIPGAKIRVLSFFINYGATPSTVTFNSKGSGAGTAKTPAWVTAASGGIVAPQNDSGWFETNEGEGLTVTTAAGSTTGIILKYEIIKLVK
jgi:hypothetical protein